MRTPIRAVGLIVVVALAAMALVVAPTVASATGSNVFFWTAEPAPPFGFIYGYAAESGGSIYCIGGSGTADGLALQGAALIYDTSPFPHWSVVPGLSTRSERGGMALYNNKMYIFGGVVNPGSGGLNNNPSAPPVAGITSQVYTWDLTSHTTANPGHLVVARSNCAATRIGTHVYIVGGFDTAGQVLDSIEDYDLSTNLSSVLPYHLATPVATPSVFNDGTNVYIFGGRTGASNAPSNPTNVGQKLNPNTGWLAAPASMPIAKPGGAIHPNAGNFVYITSNAANADNIMQYDIAGNAWSLVGMSPMVAVRPMSATIGSTIYAINGLDVATRTSIVVANMAAHLISATSVNSASVTGPGTVTVGTGGGGNVDVNFDALTTGGTVSVSIVPQGSLPPPAQIGFNVYGQIYDIATNADGWGTLTITLPYSGTNTHPVIWHWDGSQWRPMTIAGTAWGQITNVTLGSPGSVTFTTTSLSPFVIGDGDPAYTTGTPASSPWSLLFAAGLALTVAAVFQRRLRAARIQQI